MTDNIDFAEDAGPSAGLILISLAVGLTVGVAAFVFDFVFEFLKSIGRTPDHRLESDGVEPAVDARKVEKSKVLRSTHGSV